MTASILALARAALADAERATPGPWTFHEFKRDQDGFLDVQPRLKG